MSYLEVYGKYGIHGTCNHIREYIKANGINTVILGTSSTEFYFEVSFL